MQTSDLLVRPSWVRPPFIVRNTQKVPIIDAQDKHTDIHEFLDAIIFRYFHNEFLVQLHRFVELSRKDCSGGRHHTSYITRLMALYDPRLAYTFRLALKHRDIMPHEVLAKL